MTNRANIIPHRVPYDPAEVILLGHFLVDGGPKHYGKIEPSMSSIGFIMLELKEENFADYCIALVKSYVYENQFYELARPKVMILFGQGEEVPEETGAPPLDPWKKLRFWRVKKLDQTTEISIESGQFEQLVLEANLPGKRSPNSYAANMQLGHRSGKLTS